MDLRKHHTICPGVKNALHFGPGKLMSSYQRSCRRTFYGLKLLQHDHIVTGSVFQIDQYPIEPGSRYNFSRYIRAQVDPATMNCFSALDFFFKVFHSSDSKIQDSKIQD